MNKVVLIGRLTKDPELKYTPGTGTAVATFTLAIDRRFSKDGQKEADFISIVAWSKTAELVANYMKKGSQVGVSGRIQSRTYDAKDGTKRYITEVVADEIQFLDSKRDSSYQSFQGGDRQVAATNTGSSNDFPYPDDTDMTPLEGDDIPF
ncbi:MAG: single-stranded DNA-binding protein [Bacillota bacterium]|nr:single-stranded DNA-binding protein [Bacillota bacterium]